MKARSHTGAVDGANHMRGVPEHGVVSIIAPDLIVPALAEQLVIARATVADGWVNALRNTAVEHTSKRYSYGLKTYI